MQLSRSQQCSLVHHWGLPRVPQKQEGQASGAVLDPRDELFIVHVSSPKGGGGKKHDWRAGGALMHSMEVRPPPPPRARASATASGPGSRHRAGHRRRNSAVLTARSLLECAGASPLGPA